MCHLYTPEHQPLSAYSRSSVMIELTVYTPEHQPLSAYSRSSVMIELFTHQNTGRSQPIVDHL